MAGASPLPGYLCQVNLAQGASVGSTNLSLTNGGDDKTFTVPLASTFRYLDNTVVPVVQIERDAVQTVTITGAPTGGTFTITFGGNTTTGIAYNAAASVVQTAFQALASVGANNALVTGSAGGPYTIEFVAALGFAAQATVTASGASLTGGTSPAAVPASVQTGQTWTTIATGTYTVRYTTAQVLLNVALVGANVNCRLSSFNYLPYAAIAQATDITFQPTRVMLDGTTFQGASGTGYVTVIPGLMSGSYACKTWQLNTGATVFTAHLTAGDLVIVSFVAPDGVHAFEGFCYLSDTNIQGSITTLAAEDLTFKLTGIAALL